MATRSPEEERLFEAFSIVADTTETEETVVKLRDLLEVDHRVYHSSKPASSSADAYIRLTYPRLGSSSTCKWGIWTSTLLCASGFLALLPFDWSELRF